MNYDHYTSFPVVRHDAGIVEMILGADGKLPVADAAGHGELAEIWRDFDKDPDVSVIVVRGQAKGFSGGGTLELVAAMADDFEHRARVWREARDIVYNMINCSNIVISAINGPAVGGGLAVALLADISIAAKDARLIDGHTRLGVAAGDHVAIIWPLLCGMAKAKLHLLLSDEISGEEAERIGLVSQTVDAAELLTYRLRHCPETRRRPAKRPALDQVQPQQLAAPGRPGFAGNHLIGNAFAGAVFGHQPGGVGADTINLARDFGFRRDRVGERKERKFPPVAT